MANAALPTQPNVRLDPAAAASPRRKVGRLETIVAGYMRALRRNDEQIRRGARRASR